MAHLEMKEVVYQNEFGAPRMGLPNSLTNAKQHLTAQMFTDAVFNQDIRVIQTIINRIDGGVPKDTELEQYQTLFGECMLEVLEMTGSNQLKVMPTDSVMLALCKSLYDLATQDIYHTITKDKDGKYVAKKKNPTTEQKTARDLAMKMVLERAGGRKTQTEMRKERQQVSTADWIGELPQSS